MRGISNEEIQGIGVALNEATLLGAEVSKERKLAAITLSLLILPKDGPPPEDPRVQVLLSPVGRVAASLRHGRWDDPAAPVQNFELEELLPVVQSFRGLPIYGWEFIDLSEDHFQQWEDRLSLNWQGDPEGMAHSIFLFQEGSAPERILDLRIWFRDIFFRRPTGEEIPIRKIIEDGRRWWDGLYSGDPRTAGHGIFPADPEVRTNRRSH